MGNCRCKIWHRVVAVLLALTFLSAYLPEGIIDLDITAEADYDTNIETKENTSLVTGELKFKKVSLGSRQSAAITTNGDLYMWGYNSYGQLGNGTTKDSHTPIKIMNNVADVILGTNNTAAITTDGDLYMWGNNDDGQLGDGTTEDSYIPKKIMSNIVNVGLGSSTAGSYSSAVTINGGLYMWGDNFSGRLGNGTTEDSHAPIKIMSDVTATSLGSSHSAAVTIDGDLYMWGNNFYGQLGDCILEDNCTSDDSYTPKKIMSNVACVDLKGCNSAAITTNGDLYMWGKNDYGQLANGETDSSHAPVKIMSNIADNSLGTSHSAAITVDGDLYMWGWNYYGQLGNGTTNGYYTTVKPQKIKSNITDVSLGDCHSAAITTDGDLYVWGCNNNGQLGNGTTENSYIPIKISIPSEVIEDSETSDTDIFEYEIIDNKVHIISCNTTATEVTIPDSIEGYPVIQLRNDVFSDCPNLTTVNISENLELFWVRDPWVNGTFESCSTLQNVKVSENNPKYCDIDGVVFTKDGSSLVFYPHGKTQFEYTVPDGVTAIDCGAFFRCNNLTKIVLSDGCLTIEPCAFRYCKNLESIILPNDCETIGTRAFEGCDKIVNLSIPDSVKSIGPGAFDLTNLPTEIDGILYVDTWIVGFCGVEDAKIVEGTKHIADFAFSDITQSGNTILKSVYFPDGLISIGELAFGHCDNLSSATIPKSVTSINESAFYNCPNLTIYGYAGSYAETYAKENDIPFVALDDNISFYLSESPIEIYDLTEKTISISSSKPILANTTFICRDTDIVNIKSVVNRSLSDCEVSLTAISFGSTLLDIYVDGEIVSSITVTVKNINSYESSTLIKPLRESFSLGQNEIINISAQYLGKDKILTAEWDVVDNEIISIERSFTNSIRAGTPFEEKHVHCQIKGKKSGQTVLKVAINNKETAYIPVIVEPITLTVYASRTDLNILEGEYFQIFANTRINDEIIKSDITYSFDESAFKWTNKPLYEAGLVSALKFKALKEGLHTITITDNTYGITKIIPITVDKNENNTVTIYNVPTEYLYDNKDYCTNFIISGIYIDEFKSSLRRTSAGQVLCDVTFDAYNTKSIFGIADVYDSNGRLIKSYPINPVKNMPTSIVESTLENLGKLANDIFVEGNALTHRQSAGYSEHTQITINDIPQGGYIRITNNPIESKSLYIIDSIDIILSYKSFSKSSLDNYDSIRNSIANELCKSFPDYFIEALAQDEDKLIKDAIVSGFSKKAISNGFEISIDGFTAVFVNWLNECDFNGIVKNVLKNYITDFTEDLFTSASGWIGVTIEQLMNYSKAINLICKINDFTNSIDNARQDIHIPRNGAIGCEDITVIGAFDEYTSLNVFRIQIEDEIINNIPEININNSELICEYDISIYRNGELFQPTSKVSVEIRIPDNLLPYKDKLVIYRVENDGTVTKLVSKLSDNNIITFETEHFSKYLLCPTHAHSFSNLWHYGSTHHWHECNCGEKTDMAVHTENNGVVTVQPTATSSGVVTYSCSICDFVTRTATISPTGGGYIPPYVSTPVYPPKNPTTSIPDDEEDEEMFDDAEEDYESEEDEESIYEEFEDEEEITISLDNDLKKLTAGKANINTKKSFFDDSATICLSNTEESYNAALMAIEELGEDNPVFYAFDISIFNEDQNDISDKFSGGYVTFKIPVPKSMVEMTDEISVYHIEDGYPEYLESEIIDDDGFVRVKFSATEFSPFMFIVQGSNANYENPDSDNDDENDNMFIGKDEIQINDGNANPDTNVKTAIIIPTAVIGCVLLLKKPKRKRHR